MLQTIKTQKENSKNVTSTVGVRVIKGEPAPFGTVKGGSKQVEDPFKDLYADDALLEPPYNPLNLVKLPEQSNILTPLMDAYKTNITGFGYNFRFNIDMESEEIEDEIKDRAKKEWLALEFFYEYSNYDQTFTEITKKMIQDRETIGWGAIEVLPRGNGKPGGFEHIPAHTIRLSPLDPMPQKIPVIAIDVYGEKVKVSYIKKFRKFCQIRSNSKVWFKEFGDPRVMDATTGKFEYEQKELIPFENRANSLMYFPIAVSYSSYGIPRWMGNILSIIGSRKAEELNYYYFEKGKHVPMAVIIKNGSLTESSVQKLEDYSKNIQGVENAHGFLVLEADAGSEEEEDIFDENSKGSVDIKLQPLTEILQQDALFQDYDQKNRDKLRASMRLPPVYTGETRDYTRATADTARAIAEEQIFNPERMELAHKFNKQINTALDIRYVNLYFKGPDLSNKKELSQALNPYIKAGALTPNMLIGSVSDLLGIDFEQIPEEWANKPLALALAEMTRGVEVPESKPKIKGASVVDNTAEEKVES